MLKYESGHELDRQKNTNSIFDKHTNTWTEKT